MRRGALCEPCCDGNQAMLCDEEFLAYSFGEDAERIFGEFAELGLRRPLDGRALQAAAVRLLEIGLRYGPEVEREATAFLLEVMTEGALAERRPFR